MARTALARLSAGAHPQRNLQSLAKAWFSPWGELRGDRRPPPHAKPTFEGIHCVLRYLSHSDRSVAGAAFDALRSAAHVCECNCYAEIPLTIWDVPGVVDAVRNCLTAAAWHCRISAAGLAAEFRTESLVDALTARLSDDVYSVRWLAVVGLAGYAPNSLLATALAHSWPKDRQAPYSVNFDYAISAMAELGIREEEIAALRPASS